ncbi:MAG: hypothetical protein JO090_03920 [Rhizobacter sp.]|nr:hypothetical protein [Rhizobacter sp.]
MSGNEVKSDASTEPMGDFLPAALAFCAGLVLLLGVGHVVDRVDLKRHEVRLKERTGLDLER